MWALWKEGKTESQCEIAHKFDQKTIIFSSLGYQVLLNKPNTMDRINLDIRKLLEI